MMLEFDDNERALLVHLLNRARLSYEQSEIDPDLKVENEVVRWRCEECGTKGPSRGGLTHSPTCFFRRVENLRAKLLTPPTERDRLDHLDSQTS